jgi:serine/threonine protein kinase
MEPSDRCPEPGTWKTFLDGELLDDAAAELAGHLETCEACQQTLERLAAGKETWEGTAKQIAEADANADSLESSGHLRDVLDELKQGIEIDSRASSITPESLTFLAPSDEEDSIGRLGSYEVLEIVGAGGMGIVMRAWDSSLRRIVAIKVLASHLANSAAARRRFVREAQAAAAVSHDHVVAIHAVESDHEPPYLVMQYIEGKTLQQRLDGSGPLHVREVLRIGQQTALGLSAAHQQGIVHRDIKPANILLENGVERVRITDFGLARAIDDASMTQSGVVAGTPLFMAPEQAQGIQLDHRADLFSLGSVLYVMCTGRPPFRSSTMIGVIRRVCDDSPRPIREINPDVPEWLCKIIDRLLAKAPKDRYASAEEVAELLGSCLAHVQQPTIVPLPAETSGPPLQKRLADSQRVSSGSAFGDEPSKADPDTSELPEVRIDPDCNGNSLPTTSVTPGDVRREVFWPALMMGVSGVTHIVMHVVPQFTLHRNVNFENFENFVYLMKFHIVMLLPPAYAIYGSIRMVRLQSRNRGLIAAIMTLITWAPHPLSWPAGILALIVLRRSHVQREFVRISNERLQPDEGILADDELIPGQTRPAVSLSQKVATCLFLVVLSVAGTTIPSSKVLIDLYRDITGASRNVVISCFVVLLLLATYLAIALFRYGLGTSDAARQKSTRQSFRKRITSPTLWFGTLVGVSPCLLIAADMNATTYNDLLSTSVLPVTLVGSVLLIIGAALNLKRAHSARCSGQATDPPAFALLDWPTPMLAILWTAFIAWSDLQGTVGYVRFQIDDHNSWVSLTSDDSQIDLKRRSGWNKLRVPEGKYYWRVSDAGLDSDHAVNGTIDIESPRTSVVDAKVHGRGALDRVKGYWKVVSTDVMWRSQDSEKPDWARSPTWILVDDTSISYWDSSGKPLDPWSLKLDAENTFPKLLQLHDVSTDERLAEGQWAVGQNELLLRLYPPRKTTSPYLASIFSKPVNGDLVVFRFEKLPKPPAWLDSESPAEIADPDTEPFSSELDLPENVSSIPSGLDGRWIVESITNGQKVSPPKIMADELVVAGHWFLSVDLNGTISKGLVSFNENSGRKQIQFTMGKEDSPVFHGIYKSDQNSLDICCIIPEVSVVEAGGDIERLSSDDFDKRARKIAALLTDECFDQPLRNNRIILRCCRPPDYRRTPIQSHAPDVEGLVLETRQANPRGMRMVEISIGEDDGLMEGYEMSIHRKVERGREDSGIQPLGKIRLKLVTPDRSIGIVTLLHEGASLEKGDSVTALPR